MKTETEQELKNIPDMIKKMSVIIEEKLKEKYGS